MHVYKIFCMYIEGRVTDSMESRMTFSETVNFELGKMLRALLLREGSWRGERSIFCIS